MINMLNVYWALLDTGAARFYQEGNMEDIDYLAYDGPEDNDYPDSDDDACWQCGGEGGYHDCGEDCCCCAKPKIDVICQECHGDGGYLICSALPHTTVVERSGLC